MIESKKQLLRELLAAIEHIMLPMMLEQHQADVYNDLVLKAERVRLEFDL